MLYIKWNPLKKKAKKSDIPELIGNRWRIKKELGVGGMGRVLLAETEEGAPVAVKLLKAPVTEESERRIEQFKSEFSILKELSHPGINKVYDFGLDETLDAYYFTTEYIAGEHFLKSTEDSDL